MINIRRFALVICTFLLPVISACTPVSGHHGFTYFQGWKKVELLDYHYYNQYNGGIKADSKLVRQGSRVGVLNISGPMYFGEYFYVKWQDIKTGKVYETRIALKSRYLDDMERTSFVFEFEGDQLKAFFVQFFTESLRAKYARWGKKGAKHFVNRIEHQIYPSLDKEK